MLIFMHPNTKKQVQNWPQPGKWRGKKASDQPSLWHWTLSIKNALTIKGMTKFRRNLFYGVRHLNSCYY